MNREWLLFNLREAEEEMRRTIADIESQPDYGYGELAVAITHVYHHLNSAWNAREASQRRVETCTEEDFLRWRQFPEDIYLGP
jgi:hypothetical protein